jgi:hypothetical protein
MKNKKSCLLSTALAVLVWGTAPALAGTETVGGVTWHYNLLLSGVAQVTKAEPVSGNMTIPATLGGKKTVLLASKVFENSSGLTGISMPASLLGIGASAFDHCTNLTAAAIGDGVLLIGSNAFRNCERLVNLTWGTSLTSIGENAFKWCGALPSVSIPDSVTNIGNSAFWQCNAMKTLELGKGVRGIGEYAFRYCRGLSEVRIPASMANIGAYAFSDGNLQTLVFEDAALSIGKFAFYKNGLKNVTLPKSAVFVGPGAFADNGELASINVAAGNTHYASKNGVLYSADGQELVACPGGRAGAFAIPSGVKRVGSYAFCGAKVASIAVPATTAQLDPAAFGRAGRLVSVDFAGPVAEIPQECFAYCYDLERVALAGGASNIGEYAFESCSRLKSVSVPSGVTNIGYAAFTGCGALEQLAVPVGVKSIGGNAFAGTGLKELTLPASVKSVGADAFKSCAQLRKLYVPASWKGTDMLSKANVPTWCTVVYVEDPAPQTVWRFYSKTYKGHFFTIDEAEKEDLITTNPNWKFEGGAYRAHADAVDGTVALHRFYSKNYRGHFFTINEEEMQTVRDTNQKNWKYEGIAYFVYSQKVAGSVPVHRFWSKRYKHHFYTIDEAEKDDLIANNPNWAYEGVAFHALPLAKGQTQGAAKGVQAAGLGRPGGAAEGETVRTDRLRSCGIGAGVVVTTSDGRDGRAVVDGDEGTGWSPDRVEEGTWAWVMLSFAEPVEAARVEVVGENLPEEPHILFSEDADEWTEELPGWARYVWVAIPSSENGPALVREIRVSPAEE